MRPAALLALLLLVLCGTPAEALQLVDAAILPGDLFQGEIDAADDLDVVSLDAVEGTVLKLQALPAKGSAVLVTLRLVVPGTGQVLATASASKKKLSLTSPALPATGGYEIEITGTAGSTGSYLLRYAEVLPAAAKVQQLAAEAGAGAEFVLDFDAVAGLELSASIQRGSPKSPADPAAPTILDPGDEPLPIPAGLLKESKAGDRFTLKKLPLAASGGFQLRVLNEGQAGPLKAKLQLKRGKPRKFVLDELPVGESGAPILTGLLRSPFGQPLAGVTVSVEALPTEGSGGKGEVIVVETSSAGSFFVDDPPVGPTRITLDGSTQDGTPGDFARQVVVLDLPGADTTELPLPVVLPDLAHPDRAEQLGLPVGPGGAAQLPIDAESPALPLSLSGPAGTTIQIGGSAASGSVDLILVPVAPDALPRPLRDGGGLPLDAASYAFIDPPDATFGTGLDLLLPNDRGFPAGTNLELWRFDAAAGAWIPAGNEGTGSTRVTVDGEGVLASSQVRHGGYLALARAVDPGCATTVQLSVLAAGTNAPLPGVAVTLALGAAGRTDINGELVLPLVPAYDPSQLPACTPIPIFVTVTAPATAGGGQIQAELAAGNVVPGGVTGLGPFLLTLPITGSVVGRLVDNGQPIAGGTIQLDGPTDLAVLSDDQGRFFHGALPPGSYVASHVFTGADGPTEVAFGVALHGATAIAVERSGGQGSEDVTVRVLRPALSEGEPPVPLAGVKVTLAGSDPFSSEGLVATTNAAGRASFTSVDPPYDVSAQLTQALGDGSTALVTSSLLGVEPTGDDIGLPLHGVFLSSEPVPDSRFVGTVLNLPEPEGDLEQTYEVLAFPVEPGQGPAFFAEVFVDGSYELEVLSGRAYHLLLREITTDFSDLLDEQVFVSGVRLMLEAGDPGPGGELTLDFDLLDAAFVPFESELPLTLNGLPSPANLGRLTFRLLARGPGLALDGLALVEQVDAVDGDSEYESPASLRLPAPDHPGLLGLELAIQVEHDDADLSPAAHLLRGARCERPWVEGLAEIVLGLPAVPVLTSPAHGSGPDLTPFLGQPIQWLEQSKAADRGFVTLTLEGSGFLDSLGSEHLRWTLSLPLQQGTAELPPTFQAALAAGDIVLGLEVFVLGGTGFDFQQAFSDESLASLLAALAAANPSTVARVRHELALFPD